MDGQDSLFCGLASPARLAVFISLGAQSAFLGTNPAGLPFITGQYF